MAESAEGWQNVGNVTVDGGHTAGSRHAREQAAGPTAAFDNVESTTDFDLRAILHGQAFGRDLTSSRLSQGDRLWQLGAIMNAESPGLLAALSRTSLQP